ncbi:mediator complex, subunit Med5 [Bombardia bombarda]|uniref:Mediator of RNA polymerase II transcription subunit 5 n=1 Tax=Bombardia bombarda TaxID=252184 RepID=A0AA39XJV6_9PEZI|nr:mediator complex, subunit Med5 [Bombardia bombarda]
MDRSPATATSVAQWGKFLSRAESQRLDPDKFASFAPMMHSKYPLPRPLIADLLLRPTKSCQESLDPRVHQYLQALLKHKLVDTTSVLWALAKYSTTHTQARAGAADEPIREHGPNKKRKQSQQLQQQQHKIARWRNSYGSDEVVFYRLGKTLSQGPGIKSTREALDVARMLAKWVVLFNDAAATFARDAFGAIHSLQADEEMDNSRGAFLIYLLSVFENPVVLATFSRPISKDIRKLLSDSLENLVPSIVQRHPDLAARLENLRIRTLAGSEAAADKKDTMVSEINSYMDNLIGLESLQLPEMPIVNSRAGLYIYFNAALIGRPLVDDSALFAYIHNRYQGDTQTSAVQIILASFDVLANAVFHNEGSKSGHLLKSFLVNKIPLVLGSLAASSTIYPFDSEFCITQALGQVDTNVFPTLSGMFDMQNNSSFQDSVRQDFCFACQLHGLLSQQAIETLLGDITYQSLPDEGRYVKDTLVQSCLEDPERISKLIGELDNMNGNVGAAAQAIIEVIGSLCLNRETMTLKHMCSQLASKPLSLDILLLFDKPYRIIHPLCELLDNWGGYDEDQGEYQPVYEEFGSILLLLLAFVYRYGLTPTDLGITSPDSFVGKLLGRPYLNRPLDELTEQEKSHMNGWINGLFHTEAGGLGDELMASCPPQDFYLLMPTLFHQIFLALSTGYLTEDMLKGGLEYLVDILLLPSLVPALLYLSNQLWADQPQGQAAIIRVLQLILRPNSISHEASAMLSSVLNIIAKPLEHSLRSYQRQDPKSQEVEPLLRALKENLPLSRRTGGTDHNELESWAGTHITPAAHAIPAGGAAPRSSSSSSASNNHNNNNNSNGNNNINNGGGPASTSGLMAAVRLTVTNLVQWASHPTLNGMPSSYTHRQILVALKMHGARHVLSVLLDELKTQTELGNAAVAYDVVTAILCAPDVYADSSAAAEATAVPDETTGAFPAPVQRRITLREALKSEAEDWRRVQRTEGPAMAEAVVRLHRRVEAQMAIVPEGTVAAMMQGGQQGQGQQQGDGGLDIGGGGGGAGGGGMRWDRRLRRRRRRRRGWTLIRLVVGMGRV